MKYIILILLFTITACNSETEKIITTQVPSSLHIESFPAAKEVLEAEIKSCGGGVIEGARNEKGEALPNSCSHTIKVDENFIADHTVRTGLLKDPKWALKQGVTFYTPKPQEVPENFDIRDLMKNGVPDIRQQACGDCWAWATHHSVELNRAVSEKAFDHSSQSVLSCSNHGSCSGGYMSTPDFLVGRGLPYESDYPYVGRDTNCKYSKDELAKGWDGKILAAPWIGSSKGHSRFFKGQYESTKIKDMMAAIYQNKAPLVVTVASFSQSSSSTGPVTSCFSAGTNHMVDIVGWSKVNGKRVAHVWNSHGKEHGDGGPTSNGVKTPGVSSIVWECANGSLNRNLGQEARVVQYKAPCTPPDVAFSKPEELLLKGSSIKLGKPQGQGITCKWLPTEGVESPESCETYVSPERSTEYHLEVTNDCGTTSAMVLVKVLGPRMEPVSTRILTPYGEVEEEK